MRKERLGRTRVALSAGLLVGGLWAGAAALFTDTATTDASFTTGSVDIDVTQGGLSQEGLVFFSASDMAPGEIVFAPLAVENNGSLDFTYTMSSSADNADGKNLRDELVVGIEEGVTSCDDAGWGSGTDVNTGSDWTDSAIASRALSAGGSEDLCFRVELPAGVGNGVQDAETTATLVFSADNV